MSGNYSKLDQIVIHESEIAPIYTFDDTYDEDTRILTVESTFKVSSDSKYRIFRKCFVIMFALILMILIGATIIFSIRSSRVSHSFKPMCDSDWCLEAKLEDLFGVSSMEDLNITQAQETLKEIKKTGYQTIIFNSIDNDKSTLNLKNKMTSVLNIAKKVGISFIFTLEDNVPEDTINFVKKIHNHLDGFAISKVSYSKFKTVIGKKSCYIILTTDSEGIADTSCIGEIMIYTGRNYANNLTSLLTNVYSEIKNVKSIRGLIQLDSTLLKNKGTDKFQNIILGFSNSAIILDFSYFTKIQNSSFLKLAMSTDKDIKLNFDIVRDVKIQRKRFFDCKLTGKIEIQSFFSDQVFLLTKESQCKGYKIKSVLMFNLMNVPKQTTSFSPSNNQTSKFLINSSLNWKEIPNFAEKEIAFPQSSLIWFDVLY